MTDRNDRNDRDSDLPEVEILGPDGQPRTPLPEGKGIVLARQVYPRVLPIVDLDARPLFPGFRAPLLVERGPARAAVGLALESSDRLIGLVLRRRRDPAAGPDAPLDPDDLHRVGVVAEILQAAPAGDGGAMQLLVHARDRIRIRDWVRLQPAPVAEVEYLLEDAPPETDEVKAWLLAIVNALKELVKLEPLHKEELRLFTAQTSLSDPGRLADFAAALTSADGGQLQEILETVPILKRLEKVLRLLKKEIEISALQVEINRQVEQTISRRQREFFLREQLKAIKRELGLEKDEKEAEIERLRERLERIDPPEEARRRIEEELDKLALLEPAAPEFAVTRGYLDWLTSLPWGVHTEDVFDLDRARRILDRDHYGLDDVKDRILEFLGTGRMTGTIAGSIILFVGPPGVGKTSIGRSIAEAIGRKFFRFSVGGMRDEAEIKGHRRTYIGAMPGKFIQAIRSCGSANPVIMLDEVDKIGASYLGDPASALLEVLDPEQNREFLDHYLDVRFDLSQVLFICTANVLDTIPRPLLDRMERIRLPGYVLEEKLQIARRHLLPRQLRAHGVTRRQVTLTTGALREIIDGWAREPGVRGLEQQIRRVIRKAVRRIVEGRARTVRVDRGDVAEWLGRRLFVDDRALREPVPGVVTGLAWTPLGGDTLAIEARAVRTGQAGFRQTGQLGDVMVESSEIAYTLVRSLFDADPERSRFFAEHAIHLHVPAGATPKDGPSAGITMATALWSLATGRAVRRRLAMTGELTLTGRVLAVGGIKEKLIAARRAGVRRVILPEANREDVAEVPEALRRGIEPVFVERFEQVLDAALPARTPRRAAAQSGASGRSKGKTAARAPST
ncbi:MAG: endopeptidase La [Acidobacteriota bacterium]